MKLANTSHVLSNTYTQKNKQNTFKLLCTACSSVLTCRLKLTLRLATPGHFQLWQWGVAGGVEAKWGEIHDYARNTGQSASHISSLGDRPLSCQIWVNPVFQGTPGNPEAKRRPLLQLWLQLKESGSGHYKSGAWESIGKLIVKKGMYAIYLVSS